MKWDVLSALGAMIAVTAVLVSSGIAQDKPASASPVIGAAAPTFSLEDQAGKKVSLADYAGKIVVLEWFNEECPIVQRHYKDEAMNKLAKKYKEKDVVWLAINSTSGKDNAANKKAADAWKMDRPILNDASGAVGHKYQATNTPGMYIIDKSGNLAYWGAIDDNESGSKTSGIKNYVETALDELLAGKPVSTPKTKPYGCTVKYAS
jgi:peroxiredoxin